MLHMSRWLIALLLILMIGPAFLFGPQTWDWIEQRFGPSEAECQREHDAWRSTGVRHMPSWKGTICSRRFGTYGSPNG